MDRDAVRAARRTVPEEPPELLRAADGLEAPDGELRERLEQARRSHADRERALGQERRDRSGHQGAQTPAPPLQVEHQLGPRLRRTQEVVQRQAGHPGTSDVPPVPEQRQRTDALEVAYLDASAEEPEVSFDERDAKALCVVQRVEPVAAAVCDHKGPRGTAARYRLHAPSR